MRHLFDILMILFHQVKCHIALPLWDLEGDGIVGFECDRLIQTIQAGYGRTVQPHEEFIHDRFHLEHLPGRVGSPFFLCTDCEFISRRSPVQLFPEPCQKEDKELLTIMLFIAAEHRVHFRHILLQIMRLDVIPRTYPNFLNYAAIKGDKVFFLFQILKLFFRKDQKILRQLHSVGKNLKARIHIASVAKVFEPQLSGFGSFGHVG